MNVKRVASLLCVAISALAIPAYANRLAGGEHYALASDSTIDDDLLLAVKEAALSGRITGDLLFAGSGLELFGPVEGNVLAAGQHLLLKGPVKGSVRAFCSDLTVEGSVGRNLIACGGGVRLPEGSSVEKDAFVCSGNLTLGGKVGGHLTFNGGEAVISGTVAKGAKLKADRITLTSTARIEGDFIYTSKRAAVIEPGAVVTGQTVHELPKKKGHGGLSGWGIFWWLVWRASELITGFLLLALFRKQMTVLKETAAASFLKTFGIGLLAFVVTPVLAILFAILIIGLPVGLVLGGLYLMALFLSCNFTGLPLGESILRLFKKEGPFSPYASMTVGVLLIQLLEELPYFGVLVLFVTAWVALGMIIFGCYQLSRQLPEQKGTPATIS